jgi:hypothetical protein
VLATPVVRRRAGATVRRVRDRVDARMTPSDVLELGDDATTDQFGDLPSAGELVTDGTLPAPEAAVPDADVPIAR